MSGEAADVKFVAEAKFIDINGVKLEVLTKGKGSPLLFLHGMDGAEKAATLLNHLAETHTVYAPSHPGFGASTLPDAFTTVDDLSYFYLDLLDHLDLKAAAIVGFSFGGWIAAEMLTKDCSRVARVVLGAPLGLRTGDRKAQRVTDVFMLPAAEQQARMQVTPVVAASPKDKSEAMLERSLRNAEALVRFGWSPYMSNPKLEGRLHRIKIPAHFLWGEEDRIAPLGYGMDYAARLPRASLETLAKCGHNIHVDQPEAAAKSISKFIKQAAAAAA